jgi:colanic acid/amylovoran biosynthesis glycosyltransferase
VKRNGSRHPLAIVTPEHGVGTQTFIRRHTELLLPDGTVVVTRRINSARAQNSAVPVLQLDRIRPPLVRRAARSAARRLGLSVDDLQVSEATRFLRQHRVEVIMGEHLDTSLPWLDMARRLGIRFFAHAHGYDVSMRLNDPKWRAAYLRYNEADGVITMSRVSRDRLVKVGLDPSRVHVIPYGVDVPAEPIARPERQTVRCLAVGRLVPKKGPILALDAFRRAVSAHPKLHLDFVGAGPLLPGVQQFVQCLSLERCVTLHGERSHEDVQRMMREADIFIQHSITASDGNEEGLPVAVLEATAHGLPVVSTRHAGIPEAIADNVSGFLVDEGDSIAMADRIVALAGDPDRRKAMGHAGWRAATAQFSWSQERTRLRELLGVQND